MHGHKHHTVKPLSTNQVCDHPFNNLLSTMTPTLWPYSYLFITSRNTNHLSPCILFLDERKTKAKALQIRYIRYIRNQTNDFFPPNRIFFYMPKFSIANIFFLYCQHLTSANTKILRILPSISIT